jgi:polysaccharide pyruvyl transferase WcaK-like protein
VGGWAAHRHVGDDAILRVHLDELRVLGLPVEPLILGDDPQALEARFCERSSQGLEPFMSGAGDLNPSQRLGTISGHASARAPALAHPDVRRLASELAGAAALIVLGAGSLASRFASSLWTQAATTELARALHVPVVVAGVTLGPVTNAVDAMALRRILQAAEMVCTRDRIHSPVLARQLGYENVLTSWDPAARMAPVAPENGGNPAEDNCAVLCVGPESWSEHARAIDALYAELNTPTIGIPMDFHPGYPDTGALDSLRGELRHPQALRVVDPVPPDPCLVGSIARARVAFGSRYHMAVFATAHGTPGVLVHFNGYSRHRAEGLAELAGPSLRLCDAAAGPDAIRAIVMAQANTKRQRPISPPSLPAIEWLSERLRGSASGR